MRFKSVFVIAMIALLSCAANISASMIHIPTTYGLSARSMAMGNASTAITEDVCLPYFNPAAMAMTNEGKASLTYMFAQPNFEGGRKGKTEQFVEANKVLSAGVVIALDEFLKSNRKIALGFNVVLDDNGTAVTRYNNIPSDNGYFVRYGESSMGVAASLGFEIVEWFYLGGGVMISLHNTSELYSETDLAGNTKNEGLNSDTNASYAPIVALFMQFDPVSIGLSYRGTSYGEFEANQEKGNNSVNVGGSKLADIPVRLLFKDSFVPMNINFGLGWQATPEFLLAFDFSWFYWQQFDEYMKKDDVVRENVSIDFIDTYVPRIGGEYEVVNNLFLRFGYSYDQSPLRNPGSNGIYMLDNDRHIGGLGIGYDLELGLLNYAVSFDATFIHHYLMPRTMKTSDGEDEFESQGNLNGGTATITFRF